MGAVGINAIFPNGLLLGNAFQLLRPLLAVVQGMAAYAVFVFKFYRFVAARDVSGRNPSKNNAVRNSVI